MKTHLYSLIIIKTCYSRLDIKENYIFYYRASRSYSDGHPRSQIELNYAISYVMLMDHVVQGLLHPLNENAALKVDANFPHIVKAAISQGGYTSTHPLYRPNKES